MPNPYNVEPVPYQMQQQIHQNPNSIQPSGTQVPQIIQGKDVLIINGAPQNLIIVKEEQKAKPDP